MTATAEAQASVRRGGVRALWAGNPLAVVHDADGVTDEEMSRFARWTNLSETTFLCAPNDPAADYRVRIFTPVRELPFAGHPTLGTAAALVAAGRLSGSRLVQESASGLTALDLDGDLACDWREGDVW